jgi:hypothetical protein
MSAERKRLSPCYRECGYRREYIHQGCGAFVPVHGVYSSRIDLLFKLPNFQYFPLGSVDIYRMSMTKAASQTKPAKFLVVFS